MQRTLSHTLLVGLKNGANTLDKILAVFPQTEYILTYIHAIILLSIHLREIKLMFTEKPVHKCES